MSLLLAAVLFGVSASNSLLHGRLWQYDLSLSQLNSSSNRRRFVAKLNSGVRIGIHQSRGSNE